MTSGALEFSLLIEVANTTSLSLSSPIYSVNDYYDATNCLLPEDNLW